MHVITYTANDCDLMMCAVRRSTRAVLDYGFWSCSDLMTMTNRFKNKEQPACLSQYLRKAYCKCPIYKKIFIRMKNRHFESHHRTHQSIKLKKKSGACVCICGWKQIWRCKKWIFRMRGNTWTKMCHVFWTVRYGFLEFRRDCISEYFFQ